MINLPRFLQKKDTFIMIAGMIDFKRKNRLGGKGEGITMFYRK